MPNKKGGKKYKRGKRNMDIERILIKKNIDENQEYGKITQVNGNARFNVFCFDGIDRLGICAGNIKKKKWVNLNDIVLVSLWEFQDEKCSIIHTYEEDEVKKLKNEKEFPSSIKLEEENEYSGENYFDYNISDEDNNSENSINLDEI